MSTAPPSVVWHEDVRPPSLDGWISLGLFTAALATLGLAQTQLGYVRDESVYFAAAESYADWFRQLWTHPRLALTDAAIVQAFDNNHEHPVLMKGLFGLSHLLFHQTLGLLSPAAAFRLPAWVLSALIPVLLFRFGRELFGRAAGLVAAGMFLLVPRHFFNAQLACFDMPIAALWGAVVYTFHRALGDERWGVWTGVVFGLALATKHNALFLPFVLLPFGLVRAFTASSDNAHSPPAARAEVWRLLTVFAGTALGYLVLVVAWGANGLQAKLQPLSPPSALFVVFVVLAVWRLRALRAVCREAYRPLLALTSMAVLGPALFYALWPYLWHHPVDRTAWYLAFHAQHNHYAWFYLGELLRAPPFPLSYVAVKTALTVPLSLFVPMVTGLLALGGRTLLSLPTASRSWVRPPSLSELLVGANALASILIISHPQVPHFGGVKHWLPSMLFLSLLGGAAIARSGALVDNVLGRQGSRSKFHSLGTGALATLLFTPALWASVRIHPYGTSSYSETAGGLPGAASLGMQRQFWSNNVTGVLPWINAHAAPGARIYLHEVNGFSFRDYQRNGQLRQDLRAAGGPEDADIAAYQYHQEFREQEFNIWQAFGTTRPVTGLYLDETPQVVVYQRPPT